MILAEKCIKLRMEKLVHLTFNSCCSFNEMSSVWDLIFLQIPYFDENASEFKLYHTVIHAT